MSKTITVTKAQIQAALTALERTGPVLSAHKKGGYLILYLCGDKEPLRWKLAASPRGSRPAAKRAAPKSKAKVS